jgi:alpha-ketoglutarate-dependent taurine dioxygenase
MMDSERVKPSLKRTGGIERKAVAIDAGELVTLEAPSAGSLPLTIRATVEGVDLCAWSGANRSLIDARLAQHGAILFRGFAGTDLEGLARFVRSASGELLEYRERSSPRTHVTDNIYTSTEHPAHQPIFLHNENSYAHTWPLKIFFSCSVAPRSGGETPIADCRRIFQSIDPAIRSKFIQKRVMYVRTFNDDVGLPWHTVFGTSDRDAVTAKCRESGYTVEWIGRNGLRTKRVGQAVARHPRTGEMSWFNHATFFHVSTLERDVREALLAQYGEDNLPNNTYFGDGSPIEPAVLDHLRDSYLREKVKFSWRVGDVLFVDNVLAAHSREPFEGPRNIHVAMSESCTERDI